VITVSALFQDLPDGTDYMPNLTVSSAQVEVEVQVVTLDYMPLGNWLGSADDNYRGERVAGRPPGHVRWIPPLADGGFRHRPRCGDRRATG
jgi:hypothetical protein